MVFHRFSSRFFVQEISGGGNLSKLKLEPKEPALGETSTNTSKKTLRDVGCIWSVFLDSFWRPPEGLEKMIFYNLTCAYCEKISGGNNHHII